MFLSGRVSEQMINGHVLSHQRVDDMSSDKGSSRSGQRHCLDTGSWQFRQHDEKMKVRRRISAAVSPERPLAGTKSALKNEVNCIFIRVAGWQDGMV